MLEEILAELERPPQDEQPIPAETVRRWMSNMDTDVRGATYSLLTEARHCRRVVPPLGYDEVFAWLVQYWEFCLRTDPRSDWADSRYTAGYDMVTQFVSMWDEGQDRRYFDRIKGLLEDLYVTGTEDVRVCVEQAVVEHLFERKEIREFFKDWQGHPQFGAAYEAGMLWVRYGGHSPLTDCQEQNPER